MGATDEAGLGGAARPFVSVVIACRNEEAYIARCLDSVLHSGYDPGRMEILVVDGLSTDNTRRIVQEYALNWPQVRLVDNPRRSIPAAWNTGIDAARGDLILRLGAHCEYSENYLTEAVDMQARSGADCVGGITMIRARDTGFLAEAVEVVLSHPFGVGASHFRTGVVEPTWVDTIPYAIMTRDLIERVGRYDERLHRSEDWDYAIRIRAAGGRTLLCPSMRSTYLARSHPLDLLRYSFSNGLWVTWPWRLFRTQFAARHLAPLFATLLAILLGAAGLVLRPAWIGLLVLVAVYAGISLAIGVQASRRRRSLKLTFSVPIALALHHAAYGVGSICGLVRPGVARARLRHGQLGPETPKTGGQ